MRIELMGKRKRLRKKLVEKEAEPKTGPFKAILGFAVVLLITYLVYYVTTRPNVPPVEEIEGSYTLFSGLESTHEPGKVKMELFFDFYCPHCYEFDSGIVPELKREYGDKLEIEYVAYPLKRESLVPIQAYELARSHGPATGEQMKEALFRAYYVEKRDIGDINVLKEIAAGIGMDPEGLEKGIAAEEKMDKIKEDVARGDRYNLEGTPMAVFDGQYKANSLAIGNLKKIIDGLIG